MKKLEKNVYFDNVSFVWQSTINGYNADDLFITKEDALEFTKKAMEEYEEFRKAENGEVRLSTPEDYVDVIDIDYNEGVRAATDENGKLIIESLNEDGEWVECKVDYQ